VISPASMFCTTFCIVCFYQIQDLVPRYFWRDEIYLALFIFKNNTQMTCYLAKSSVDFYFLCCQLSVLLFWVLFWFLYILPLSCISVTSPVAHSTLSCTWACLCCVYLPYLTLFTCILVLSLFLSLNIVINSKLLCACNRCCCAVNLYDLSPTLCD